MCVNAARSYLKVILYTADTLVTISPQGPVDTIICIWHSHMDNEVVKALFA
jgi:hypothetical protein